MIKALFPVFVMLVFQVSVLSQKLPEWDLIYTFDDKSKVELNNDYVLFSTDKTASVRFRWSYVDSQIWVGAKSLKYRSRISEYEFDCINGRFRLRRDSLFDSGEKLLRSFDYDFKDEWNNVQSGKMMQKLYSPACKLIGFRKKEPATER